MATVNSTGRMGNETGGNAKGTKSESNIKSSVMLSCGSWMACGPEFVSNTSVCRRTHLYEHFLLDQNRLRSLGNHRAEQ